MGQFLRENFLTPQVVARRLSNMNLAASAGDWLADPARGGSTRLRDGAAELLAQILESLDPERLGTQVRAGLFRQVEKLEVAPLIGQMMGTMIADRRHLPVIESLVRWAGLTLEDNEPLVRDLIHRRANAVLRWTGLDERLANSVIDGLYKLLAEVIVDPTTPCAPRSSRAGATGPRSSARSGTAREGGADEARADRQCCRLRLVAGRVGTDADGHARAAAATGGRNERSNERGAGRTGPSPAR